MQLVAQIAADNECYDLDSTARRAVEKGLFCSISKGCNELRKEIGDPAIRNIGHQGIEDDGPRQRVSQSFSELVPKVLLERNWPVMGQNGIPLEVLVEDTSQHRVYKEPLRDACSLCFQRLVDSS